jgi:hypothetical protein
MTNERPGADNPPPNGEQAGASSGPPDLAADLRALGENLKDALRAAWTSEERERLQSEIERGLGSLRQTLHQTFEEGARDLASRERMRTRVDQARARVAGLRDELQGETRDRVRSEIHDLLSRLNGEVSRSKERWTRGSKGGQPPS